MSSSRSGFEQYIHVKRFLFPMLLGIIMPVVMTLKQVDTFVWPQFLGQLIIYDVLAISFGSFILPMGKISEGFPKILHIQKPLWHLILSQIPGAIIFSFIMGFAAIILNVGLSAKSLTFFILGLPTGILIALTVQIIIDLLLEKGLKPFFLRRTYSN